MRQLLTLLIFLSWQQVANSAQSLAGYWKHEENCRIVEKQLRQEGNLDVKCSNTIGTVSQIEDASGNLVQGVPPDSFSIALVSHKNLLCGFVTSTRKNKNLVDSSLVVGWIFDSHADLVFSSSFVRWRETGTATLQYSGGRILWKVTKEIPDSYTWSEAAAKRMVFSKNFQEQANTACKDKWEAIEKREIQRISFDYL